ncbi:MAG: hypothetical protein FWC50_00815 [Planctomycetaceae bacterium]|nr:hypothetical protein [Planctomycetaceae bacterium]
MQPPSSEKRSGDALFREMLSSVEGEISISTNIRVQLNMFDKEFTGSGSYQEMKTPELYGKGTTRFRLELQIQPPASQTPEHQNAGNGQNNIQNSLTIVCDKSYIHKYTCIEGEKTLERIEIAPLMKAVGTNEQNDIPTEISAMCHLGGMAGMLREVRNQYDFTDTPIRTQINEKNGAVGVWKIRGRLKPALIQQFLVHANGKKTKIPEQIPTCIDIYIGVEDRFPFRLDYFWTADGSEPTGEPFASLLYYNMILHDGNIAPGTFEYLPSENIHPIDVTDQAIERILHSR